APGRRHRPSSGPLSKPNLSCRATPISTTSRPSPQRRRVCPAPSAREPASLPTSQRENDDDGIQLHDRPATERYVQTILEHCDVHRTRLSCADRCRNLSSRRRAGAVPPILSCGVWFLEGGGRGVPGAPHNSIPDGRRMGKGDSASAGSWSE